MVGFGPIQNQLLHFFTITLSHSVKAPQHDPHHFACAAIGKSNLSCGWSQNGKACFASILLADVVSVGTRVECYHDGLLVVAVLMYAVVFGKADMLILVDLFNRLVECRAQNVGGIMSTLGKPMLVVPHLLWASLIAIRLLLLLSALAELVRLSSTRVMLSSRNRLSLLQSTVASA